MSLVFSGDPTTSTATMSGACTHLSARQPCTYTATMPVPTNESTQSVTLNLNSGTPQGGMVTSGTLMLGEVRASD